MSVLIIAVGGTGQHVATAIARLRCLRAIPGPLECLVIDADAQGELAHATKTFDGITEGEYGLPHPLGESTKAFSTPFDPKAAGAAADGKVSLRALLQIGKDAGYAADRAVADALFTPVDLDHDVTRGFYARPLLGATAFAAQQADLIKNVAQLAGKAERVFVTGSFIGGTGAGVVPRLVEACADRSKWHGAFLLNWMSPASAGDTGGISQAMMLRNNQHGLDYFYRHVRPRLRAAALIGPPEAATGDKLLEPAVPGKPGSETRSYYHLVAAWALQHFQSDTASRLDGTVMAFSHELGKPAFLLDRKWDGGVTLRSRVLAALEAHVGLMHYLDKAMANPLFGAFGIWRGSRKEVPTGLRDGVASFSEAAGVKPKDFIVALRPRLARRAEALERSASYVTRTLSTGVSDPHLSKVREKTLDWLKERWSEPIERTAEKAALPALANDLADKLTDRLLEVRGDR